MLSLSASETTSERCYQEVQPRSRMMLLPPCLDDYVSEHNTVRMIDTFVGTLNLEAMEFAHTEAKRGTVSWRSTRRRC